jgi:Skp family chaperone for outer membrane proteins
MKRVLRAVVLVTIALVATGTVARAQAPGTAPASGCGGPQRISFIDVQRVLARSAAGVAAREQLEREKATMQKEMDNRKLELDKLREEMEKKEATLLQKVLQDVSGVIERIGKDKGCYMIVEKRGAGVIYGDPQADLTEEIIRAFDVQAPKGPAAAPPAASPAKKP